MNDNIIQINNKTKRDPIGEMVEMITELLAKPVAERAKKIKDEELRNTALRFVEDVAAIREIISKRNEIQDKQDKDILEEVVVLHSMLVYNTVKPIVDEKVKDTVGEED